MIEKEEQNNILATKEFNIVEATMEAYRRWGFAVDFGKDYKARQVE